MLLFFIEEKDFLSVCRMCEAIPLFEFMVLELYTWVN